jgi:hypothetical protein
MLTLPADVIDYLFNVNEGKHIERQCGGDSHRGALTDQVVVSYSDIAVFRTAGPFRFAGRLLDVLPGVPIFVGKPTVCRCGRINL